MKELILVLLPDLQEADYHELFIFIYIIIYYYIIIIIIIYYIIFIFI